MFSESPCELSFRLEMGETNVLPDASFSLRLLTPPGPIFHTANILHTQKTTTPVSS